MSLVGVAATAEDMKCVEVTPSNSEFKHEYVISREGEILSVAETTLIRHDNSEYDSSIFNGTNTGLLEKILHPTSNRIRIADLRIKSADKPKPENIGHGVKITSYSQLVISPTYTENEIFISKEILTVKQKGDDALDLNTDEWESKSIEGVRLKCASVAP